VYYVWKPEQARRNLAETTGFRPWWTSSSIHVPYDAKTQNSWPIGHWIYHSRSPSRSVTC